MTNSMLDFETFQLIDWYLLESGGLRWAFRGHAEMGFRHQRVGQAFFNCLSIADQDRIRGTVWDTFYQEGGRAEQITAINFAHYFLTRK